MSREDSNKTDLLDIIKDANELQFIATDSLEREKALNAIRDNFLKNRLQKATRVESVRELIINSVEDDIEKNRIPPSLKLRYLEILSKINEADLEFLSGGNNKSIQPSGITILNNNSTNSNSREPQNEIKVVYNNINSEKIINNPGDALLLKEAVELLSDDLKNKIKDKSKIDEEN